MSSTYPQFSTMSTYPSQPNKHAVARVKSHSARVDLLRLLDKRPSLTALEAMDELDDGPATLREYNYHLWVLSHYGFLEPSSYLTDRGLPYHLTHRGRLLVDVLKLQGGRT